MPVIQYQPLYRIPEAAKILKVNPNEVYSLINSGKLPYVILGSKKIKGIDLERFINSYPVGGEIR
ncbi:MAG: helix-turn-helix domain-containing protein [Muricomes sp.]